LTPHAKIPFNSLITKDIHKILTSRGFPKVFYYYAVNETPFSPKKNSFLTYEAVMLFKINKWASQNCEKRPEKTRKMSGKSAKIALFAAKNSALRADPEHTESK